MRIFSDLWVYFFNMIINVIIFQYEKGLWRCFGVWVKMCGVYGYAFCKLKSRE